MKFTKIFLLVFLFSMFSCANTESKKTNTNTSEADIETTTFDFAVWITADAKRKNDDYTQEFIKYKSAGIDEVLINTNTDPALLKRLVPIASKNGLKVHAWIMAMNRPGDSIALKHPEWYAVSKEGKSCYDTRPYVGYYQWLCPTKEASRNHVLSLVEGLAKVDGIESVHLDYIRFCDIFLPIGLLPKYNLVQDTELPEYDFCYCDACVSAFEKIHHKNPKESHNTAIDMEWKNFRLNAIKAVVDDAYEIVHKYNKNLTAAVFPYPEMADHMVRQRWDKWNIDEVYPMIYHGFYNEEVDWVGYATKQGIADLEGKKTKINTGVYLPAFKTESELIKAIQLAKDNGAKGITFFDGPALTEAQLKAIKEMKANLK
ncbi:putative glycoside hydrolase [Thalassobellus citreus]|uniref:putative glycoside hydrolase n=1 Tax=Thalassobellus citreus TaxID=3367752 RepID=UPI00379AEC1B